MVWDYDTATPGTNWLKSIGRQAKRAVTRKTISDAACQAGLAQRPVCVHSSLRSFGYVDGGANSVIQGMLDAGCTVVVPTFSSTFEVSPPIAQRIAHNGIDYDTYFAARPVPVTIYNPGSGEVDRYMGAVPKAVLAMEGRIRGNNPLNSFAALGPLSRDLIERQTALDVYAPLKRLSELGGAFVLMGTRLTSMTALHLSEEMAERTLFRRWAIGPKGDLIQVAVGSCSSGFQKLDGRLSGIEQQSLVGNSKWRIFPADQMLQIASDTVRIDPIITHCDQASCRRCPDAVTGGPTLFSTSLSR